MYFSKEEIFVDALSLGVPVEPKAASAITRSGIRGLEAAGIPTSKDITGVEIRLSKVLIKDNGTPAVWPFPGLARMYLMTIVISDVSNGAISLELKGFHKVGDNEELPVDRTLFHWVKKTDTDKSPGQIHVFASVIKSKEALRNVGEILAQVKGDSDYTSLVAGIGTLVSSGTPVGAIADLAFTVASIVGKYLSAVNDKPWFTWVQSFTDLNGDMDNLGATMRGRENNRVAMALSIIIRDQSREDAMLKMLPDADQPELAGQ